jgi:hypothetical protein
MAIYYEGHRVTLSFLRKIGDIRSKHIQGLYDLCSSPNIIGVIISSRMRWAEHVARMGVHCAH